MVAKLGCIKPCVYDEVVKNVSAIDTNELVKKHNAKIYEIRGEIPSIAGLATTAALYAVKNKIPNVSGLVKKKKNYDAKIKYIKGKYFTTSDYNKFTNDTFDAKIKQKELVNKSDISVFLNGFDLNKEV